MKKIKLHLNAVIITTLMSIFGSSDVFASPALDYNQNDLSITSGNLCESESVHNAIKALGWLQQPMDLSIRGIDVRVPFRPENNRKVGSWGETRTSPNGKVKFHAGVDLLGDVGENTFAIVDGKVIAAGFSNTLGNYAILRGNAVVPPAASCNFDILYAHLSSLSVKLGEVISSGDKIGEVGRTGNLSNDIPTHLHLELWTRPYLQGLKNRRKHTRDPMSIWTW